MEKEKGEREPGQKFKCHTPPPSGQFIAGAFKLAPAVPRKVILVDIWEGKKTFAEVGRKLFPGKDITIVQMAVSYAARDVLTRAQLEIVRERNCTKGRRAGALTFMPEGYVLKRQHKPVKKKTDWEAPEEERLLALTGDTAYQYRNGMHKGSPCFRMICDVLNEEFHKGKRRRNMNSCTRKWNRLLRECEGEV